MAKFCTQCNKKLGFLEGRDGLCEECYQKREDEQKRLEKEAKLEKKRQFLQNIRSRIESGELVYIYKYAYIEVDSYLFGKTINNEPNFNKLYYLGLLGWEIVGIVHRTVSYELETNYSGDSHGKAWGGSTGGIVGAYAVMKKVIKNTNEISDEDLMNYISSFLEV